MNVRRTGNGISMSPFETQSVSNTERGVLSEEVFHKMISVERKRTERSGTPFLLMLLDTGDCPPAQKNGSALNKIVSTLSLATRETDITGWYKHGSVVGVMFTEIDIEDRSSIVSTMLTRVSETMRAHLSFEQFNQISISFHLFPEEWNQNLPDRPSNPTLYPDLERRDNARKFFCVVKRIMDIVGSALALVVFAPLFLAIAAAIKLTSSGPVLFRQQRVGQHGVPFTFLKFRSMYINNDASRHKEYVQQLIAGKAERKPTNGNGSGNGDGNGNGNGNGKGVYKLTDDSRITRVGAFLRRTSLDELPQFINVLQGQMSLVGPRPPIAYEVEAYQLWHRRRMLEAKPGITGIWQVNGRSRVEFDDMVRLDLRYAKTWSPWMDVKILMRTPRAMLMGEGAH